LRTSHATPSSIANTKFPHIKKDWKAHHQEQGASILPIQDLWAPQPSVIKVKTVSTLDTPSALNNHQVMINVQTEVSIGKPKTENPSYRTLI